MEGKISLECVSVRESKLAVPTPVLNAFPNSWKKGIFGRLVWHQYLGWIEMEEVGLRETREVIVM